QPRRQTLRVHRRDDLQHRANPRRRRRRDARGSGHHRERRPSEPPHLRRLDDADPPAVADSPSRPSAPGKIRPDASTAARWSERSSGHEVVGADRLAAVRLGALGSLLQQPMQIAIERGKRIAGGVAAGLIEDALRLARDPERLRRLLRHLFGLPVIVGSRPNLLSSTATLVLYPSYVY